jgi:hypothetical protein
MGMLRSECALHKVKTLNHVPHYDSSPHLRHSPERPFLQHHSLHPRRPFTFPTFNCNLFNTNPHSRSFPLRRIATA